MKYLIAALLAFGACGVAMAHGVAVGDQGYIQEISGVKPFPFIFLGAKHMVTGYDHLLFLLAVIFFLYNNRDVAKYVTLFALGHSITLIVGVYFDVPANAYVIDAIIGLSIVYKALDNLGAYRRWFGFQPNTKLATWIFGLFHGFGLATKIQDLEVSQDGLLANLIYFNIGVEIGQLIALGWILILVGFWRLHPGYYRHAFATNVAIMAAGFVLMGYQITGYLMFS